MIKINSLKLKTDYTDNDLRAAILKRLRISVDSLINYSIIRKSLDARHKDDIHYVISVAASCKNEKALLGDRRIRDIAEYIRVVYKDPIEDKDVSEALKRLTDINRPIVVGFGPAGFTCAYKLAKAGLRPIVLERGADVDTRVKDVEEFWSTGKLNTSSNVQFGEGGAGTFSDGKLNTLIHDNFGRINEVFDILISHGADPSIRYVAKPHIGTDKLKGIVRSIREDIIRLGGEVRFNSCLTDIIIREGHISSVIINDSAELQTDCLILAIGHSARDTFYMLNGHNIPMERKAFAQGVRMQHPQELINRSQYGDNAVNLPPADYKLTYNTADGRGVYSFCMCPGGFVVNASSEEGMLAVNGMSNSDRSEATANSAIVVSVRESDFPGEGVLAGIEFQRELERKCYLAGNGNIPVQYLRDFRKGETTKTIDVNAPNVKGKYIPSDLNQVLPKFISDSIIEALPWFGRTIRGFDDDSALLLGLESRTSSPVRIIRGENLQSASVRGLYPCGEGAGYAGGITSAAVDGLKVYEEIIRLL